MGAGNPATTADLVHCAVWQLAARVPYGRLLPVLVSIRFAYLSETPIDAVVSSPLQRAAGTAAIAAGELGLTVVIDDDLRFTLAEIQQRWPAVAAVWRRDPEQAPPGGESFAATAHRVNRACDRLLRHHSGQTVLVVSQSRRSRSFFARLSACRLAPFTGYISAPPALTKSSGTAADLPPSIASTTPATFPDSPGHLSSRWPWQFRVPRVPEPAPLWGRPC